MPSSRTAGAPGAVALPEHWRPWRGVAGLWYARRPGSSPPLWVRASDPRDLAALAAALMASRHYT